MSTLDKLINECLGFELDAQNVKAHIQSEISWAICRRVRKDTEGIIRERWDKLGFRQRIEAALERVAGEVAQQVLDLTPGGVDDV